MRIAGMQIVIESVSYIVFIWEKMRGVDGFSTDNDCKSTGMESGYGFTVFKRIWFRGKDTI